MCLYMYISSVSDKCVVICCEKIIAKKPENISTFVFVMAATK